jgi:hypothetical protein
MLARQHVHADGGFERRAGELILDAPDRMPQVEQTGRRRALFQQAQQTPPQQRGFSQVRLALARPEQKNGWIVGDLGDGFVEAGEVFGNLDRSHHS